MLKPIDCDNSAQFKYIYSIIEGNREPIRLLDGTVLYSSMIQANPQQAIETFEIRYNEDKMATRYTYDKFIADKDLQTVIRGLKLEPIPFWLLTLFCYDYALDRCGGLKFCDSALDLINRFMQVVESCENPDFTKSQLTLKSGKSSFTLSNGRAMAQILQWIKQGYDSIEDKEVLKKFDKTDAKDIFSRSEESNSVLIWYFASLMRYFFELNPQYKGESKKCDGLSLSKNMLISTLIYNLGLSRNPSFKESDETIKGFFKQYKNKKITTLGDLYFL
ncbi:MAG: hypothetical protein NC453_29740 [Muribaculum sp.]|nr:hypothetical protein [Muribaculum sp.]